MKGEQDEDIFDHRCWYGKTSESGLCLYDRQTIRTSPQSVCCGRRHGRTSGRRFCIEVHRRSIDAASQEEDIEKALVSAIKTANHEIIKKASEDPHLKGMGTTIVVATIVRHMMYFANVGDSRLYLINQGITQLTKDHSLVEEMVRLGGIKPEEAKHHPDKNIITRAIGAKADVEVDFYEHRLKRGDIILMCTDGLSNMVEDEELFHIVQGGRDIVESGTSLVETAKENGGTDNIGVVLTEPFTDEVSIC